jgi:CrcB protein
MAPTGSVGAFLFPEVIVRTVWIGLAGFAGAVSRYGIEGWISQRSRGAFPWGTFVVNASGCFLLGFVFALLTERFQAPAALRSALTIGFLGAYTTFSTFAFETMRLAEDGAVLLAVGNVASSLGAGLLAVYAGTWAGRAL